MMPNPADPVFRAVSDPTRREILDLLGTSPMLAGEIAARFSVSRPAISKHLRVLREADLVQERPEGRKRVYSVNPVPLAEVAQWLQKYRRFWRTSLKRLKAHVEEEER